MKIHSVLSAALLSAMIFLVPSAPQAQGFLKSYACADFPARLSVDVQVLDDTAPVLRVRDAVLNRLSARGIAVSTDAPFRLLIDPDNLPDKPPSAVRDLTRLDKRDQTTLGPQTELGEQLDELRERGSRTRNVTPSDDTVRVEITINAKADGRCIWLGEARYDASGRDRWDVAVDIAPFLVDAIGKALDNTPFELR